MPYPGVTERCIILVRQEEKSAENEEMYLKAVWLLEEEGSRPAHSADIARMLGVSLPSAVEMLGKLHKKGLVVYDGRKGVSFKPQGKRVAAKIVRNLRLTELLFRDVLKIDYNTPAPCRFEHAISDEIAAAMAKVLGRPKKCPHGQPIPKP